MKIQILLHLALLCTSCTMAAKSSETVVVSYYINKNGQVVDEKVESSTNPKLNQHALASIKKMKFKKRISRSPKQKIGLDYKEN